MDSTEFEPIESVEFAATENRDVKRSVGAVINDKKDLVVSGLDWGRDTDYEYSVTVEERFKDSVLLLLLKDKFPDFLEAEAWMKEHSVPFTRWTWS